MAAGIFIGLSLYSFHPADPSFNSIGNTLVAQNFCGYFGSFLADILYQVFGLPAWMLVLACLRMSYRSFASLPTELSGLRILWATLLVTATSALLSLNFPQLILFEEQIRGGGVLGLVVSSSLVQLFNSVGASIILWTTAIVLVVFYTERSVGELFASPRYAFSKIQSGILYLNWRPILTLWNTMTRVRQLRKPIFSSATVGAGAQQTGRFFPISPSRADIEFEGADDSQSSPLKSVSLTQVSEENKGRLFPLKRRKVKLKAKVQRHVENWELPKLSLLEDPPATRKRVDEKEIKAKAKLLVDKLAQFSVRGDVVGVKPGPAVTLFEFKPAADVKISKITDLADDLSLALSSESVRIIAPIPGRDVVGIETSNSHRESVYLKDIIADEKFWEEDCKLPLALGRQADGQPKVVDLRKMPHLLVAGTTGSGKSVFVVSALTGLLFRHSPKTLKLIMVDPKQVDLAAFTDIPHLIMPPIREPKKAVGALRWAIREMEKRYRSMSKFGARGIEAFNDIVESLNEEQVAEHEKINEELEGVAIMNAYYYSPQPYIVIVVEEFGDLMAVDKANVEQAVVRLAQMARACGIHLMLAMQSPRKDVVTGLIKTNIPGRMSFKVASKMDSRIILDEGGAERLLARGDMLFLAPGVAKPERHHGPFLSEEEINSVVLAWKDQGQPEYDALAMRAIEGSGGGFDFSGEALDAESEDFDDLGEIRDDRYDEVLAYVATQKEVSASLLQRRFRLGYPRAARMIEIFESEGVVGPANGSKPRPVLVKPL